MTQALRPVRRESLSATRAKGKLRPIIITIHPTWISVKLKGLRHEMTVTHDQLYNLAAKTAAEAARRERLAAKKARKEQRNA